MASPTTVDEFLSLLHKSQLVDEAQLAACLQRVSHAARPQTGHELADLLVREGLLTNYQAVRLLQGKWHGFTIGPYKILERLGFGAASNVYLCERPVTRARVAVKVLTKLLAADPIAVQRFYREARAAGSLDHPNIVRAHDVDQDEKGHFMVMDFVDGSSIQDIIQQSGPMDVTRSAHYVRQAALGLQFAHEKGLIHRDIKPGNLLINRQGTIKLLDMGLARFFQEEGAALTQGVILGSPEYLAPEQALDSHNVDARADVYGLGATFYFMLTGQPPYAEEKTLAQKFLSKQNRDPRPIPSLRPEVPEGLVAIVERMMARDLNCRYRTPMKVAEELAPWTQTPIPPPPEGEMPRAGPVPLPSEHTTQPPAPSSPETRVPTPSDQLSQGLSGDVAPGASKPSTAVRLHAQSSTPTPSKHRTTAPVDATGPVSPVSPSNDLSGKAADESLAPDAARTSEPILVTTSKAPRARRKKRSRHTTQARRRFWSTVRLVALLIVAIAAVLIGSAFLK